MPGKPRSTSFHHPHLQRASLGPVCGDTTPDTWYVWGRFPHTRHPARALTQIFTMGYRLQSLLLPQCTAT